MQRGLQESPTPLSSILVSSVPLKHDIPRTCHALQPLALALYIGWPYVLVSVSWYYGVPADWSRIEELSRISNLNHPFTLTTKLGSRGRALFWNTLLSTNSFVVHSRWWEQKQTKHVWWFILRHGQYLIGWLINLKGFERTRLSWPIRINIQAYPWRDWGKPRKTC
jgi:hypothetical protein